MTPPPRTCAVCIGDIVGVARFEPIGRDDALVPVCSVCATEEVADPEAFRRIYMGRRMRRVGGDE